MTDRELLEKAAKAAGVEFGAARLYCGVSLSHPPRHLPKWNPLEDDGDALRLAVKLEMVLSLKQYDVFDPGLIPDAAVCASIHDSRDPYAATRRAIVRAAAAMGEAMP